MVFQNLKLEENKVSDSILGLYTFETFYTNEIDINECWRKSDVSLSQYGLEFVSAACAVLAWN